MDNRKKLVSERRCLTYGTFDLYHEAHRSHLERCKTFGAYLIVGVLSDTFNSGRGKSFLRQSLVQRIDNVRRSGLADEIIIEAYDGKVNDVIKYDIDVMVICEDWQGPLDYEDNLRRYCEVVRLERKGLDSFGAPISSTLLRGKLSIGIIGEASAMDAFISAVTATKGGAVVTAVVRSAETSLATVAPQSKGYTVCASLDEMWELVDAVFICATITSRTHAIHAALSKGKHVLCESPFDLSTAGTRQCYDVAASRNLILLQAIPSAFSPAMERLTAVAQNGKIGRILSVSVNHSGVGRENTTRHHTSDQKFPYDLAYEALLPVARILNRRKIRQVNTRTSSTTHHLKESNTAIDMELEGVTASVLVSEDMILPETLTVIGTEGYLTTSLPWHEASEFELKFKEINFEEASDVQLFQVPTRRGGYRYDLAEFVSLIKSDQGAKHMVNSESACLAAKLLELAIESHRHL